MKLLRGLLLKPTLNLLSWILRRNGNSVIIGGPLGWEWYSTIDTTHHGSLAGPANAHRHSDLADIGIDNHHARDHPTEHQDGGAQEISVAGLSGEPAELTTHKGLPDVHHTKFTITEHDTTDRHPLAVLDPAVCSETEAPGVVGAAGLALASGKNIKVISALTANQTWSGLTATLTAGEALTIGQACYMKNDGKMYKSLATAVGTMPVVALATGTIAGDAAGEFLLIGFFREDTVFDFTAGDMLYASEDTAGTLKNAAPTATGEQVQVCGKCFPSAHIIFFCPSLELVEIS